MGKNQEEAFIDMSNNLLIENEKFGIRWIKINRPKALNALNSEVLDELLTAIKSAETDESVRVVVLSGEGDKSFIAGADITEMQEKNPSQGVAFGKLGHEIAKKLEHMPQPAIAAVNGFALGGGIEMAIACDFIIASENAVFGQPEVCLGIIPGFGGNIRLAKFVGLPRAKELIFSGRKIKAKEALQIGLVNQVVPQAELKRTVNQLAESISKNSLGAIAKAKYLLNYFSETTGIMGKIDAEIQEFAELFGSEDQKEGMSAFIEKRAPKFKGI